MKNLLSKICVFALIGLFVGSASAVLIGPVRLNGGGITIVGAAGTATFSVPGAPIGTYVLRSVQIFSVGSQPTGTTENVAITIADQGITNALSFNVASNSATSSGGRSEWYPTVSGFMTTTTVNGTNVTVTASQSYTNYYIHPGASVTIALGTNAFRANIEAEAYTGFNP